MIACAFAACSNEDDPIVGPDQPQTGENNATLTISVKNAARSLTKAAAGTQTENEAKITDLTVALYEYTFWYNCRSSFNVFIFCSFSHV